MREFRYSAMTAAGQTVTGVRRAESKQRLADDLLQTGLVLLKTKSTLGSLGSLFSSSKRAGTKELRDFTQHMSTCLSAGIPLLSTLTDFREETTGPFREIVSDICNDVQSGASLDEAFAHHPDIFDSVYLAMVASGATTGRQDEAFDELVNYMEWNENLKAQTSQAMIYPAMLIVGVLGLFLLLMLFVIPRFTVMFEDGDFELPALTVGVMATGDFLGNWWWLLGLGIGAAVAGSKYYFRTEAGAYHRDRFLLKMPVMGGFIRKLALSRFCKSFSLIFSSGVDLLRVLKLMNGVVGNKVMAVQLDMVRHRVASGETLQESFRAADQYPALIQRLVAVGERTGTLDSSLLKASQQLDREIPRELKKTLSLFETLIIVVLAVLVSIAALALLMPVMQMGSNIA
jgi:type II secretory pathway component PulF